MDYFEYKNGSLFCEDVPTASITEQVGTPAYVYSARTLREHYRKIADAFAELNALVCFSIKSLSNVHLLRLLQEEGAGFDIVSGGELARAQNAGADMSKVVFAGVGKTDREISDAIAAGIKLFNVESEAEFENLSRLAQEANRKVRAGLRINPDVYDPKTHAKTATGKKGTKFGVDIERARAFFDACGPDPNVALDTIDMHIGSPIYSPAPYAQAIRKALELIDDLGSAGFEITTLDIGGGFGADYEEGETPLAAEYAAQIVPLLKGANLDIILEPGRSISANAGVLLTKVLYTKGSGQRNYVIVDAAMNDLIRPAMYEAKHFVYPARIGDGTPAPQRRMDYAPEDAIKVDVVGGVCECSDILAVDRLLPPMNRGDLLAIFSAGAYGFVMSSQYNSRPRAPEVLVDASEFTVIRRRETYDDLLAPEFAV